MGMAAHGVLGGVNGSYSPAGTHKIFRKFTLCV